MQALASPPQIGQAIRRARRARGLRQEDLAQEIGVHKNRVSVWENGRFKFIDEENRLQLAQALGLPADELEPDHPASTELAELRESLTRALADAKELRRRDEARERSLLQIQQALELAGIPLPRDIATRGGR